MQILVFLQGNWTVHQSHKNNRSNVERYEGNHGGRIPDRWPSSGRVRYVKL